MDIQRSSHLTPRSEAPESNNIDVSQFSEDHEHVKNKKRDAKHRDNLRHSDKSENKNAQAAHAGNKNVNSNSSASHVSYVEDISLLVRYAPNERNNNIAKSGDPKEIQANKFLGNMPHPVSSSALGNILANPSSAFTDADFMGIMIQIMVLLAKICYQLRKVNRESRDMMIMSAFKSNMLAATSTAAKSGVNRVAGMFSLFITVGVMGAGAYMGFKGNKHASRDDIKLLESKANLEGKSKEQLFGELHECVRLNSDKDSSSMNVKDLLQFREDCTQHADGTPKQRISVETLEEAVTYGGGDNINPPEGSYFGRDIWDSADFKLADVLKTGKGGSSLKNVFAMTRDNGMPLGTLAVSADTLTDIATKLNTISGALSASAMTMSRAQEYVYDANVYRQTAVTTFSSGTKDSDAELTQRFAQMSDGMYQAIITMYQEIVHAIRSTNT